jgi:hypothetical protein
MDGPGSGLSDPSKIDSHTANSRQLIYLLRGGSRGDVDVYIFSPLHVIIPFKGNPRGLHSNYQVLKRPPQANSSLS